MISKAELIEAARAQVRERGGRVVVNLEQPRETDAADQVSGVGPRLLRPLPAARTVFVTAQIFSLPRLKLTHRGQGGCHGKRSAARQSGVQETQEGEGSSAVASADSAGAAQGFRVQP